jgi:hypothetical protein
MNARRSRVDNPKKPRMHFDQLKRREFITLLGGAAAWPLGARAQQTERARRVGVLSNFAESERGVFTNMELPRPRPS